MVATETARSIVMVLLGLSILWIIYLIIKNDPASLVRAIIIALILGLSFYYLNQTKLEKISFSAVKEDLFPPKIMAYAYEKREFTAGGVKQIIYVFPEPGPKLYLEFDKGGKSMVINNTRQLNRVLDWLGLPPVSTGARELATITGKITDANFFRWDDYELGTMVIERGLCRNINTTESYPCISSITITIR